MRVFVEPATIPAVALEARLAGQRAALDQRLSAPLWLSFNAVCALFVVLPAWSGQSPPLLLGWLTCLSLNLLGACCLMRWLAPAQAVAGPGLSQGLAAVLGLVWGIGASVIASGLPLAQVLVALLASAAAVAATVPLIAHTATAWAALLGGFFVPTLSLLATREPLLAAVWLCAVLPLFAVFAHRQQRLAAQERGLRADVVDLHAAAVTRGLAVTVDDADPRAVRGRVAALAQALDETGHALTTLAAVPEGLLRLDRDGRVSYVNGVAEGLTGVRLGAALGRPVQAVLQLTAPGADKLTADLIEQCFATGIPQRSPPFACLRRDDGFIYGIECVVSPVRDADRRIDGLVFLLRDVTARREEANLLDWRATHDSLTALATRTTFERQLECLPGDQDLPRLHALCVFDLDGFTALDQRHGTAAGDRVLREVASVLRGGVSAPDLIARTGEDEFSVLLHDCPLDKAQLHAEELRAAIAQHGVAWGDTVLTTQASVGIVEVQHGAASLALAQAKQACLLAKHAGGNRTRALRAGAATRPPDSRQGQVARKLREALTQRRYRFALQTTQPIDAQTLQPSYAELQLQIADAQGQPGPLQTGQLDRALATDVDRRLLLAALDTLRQVTAPASREIIAVDVSPGSLCDSEFAAFVLARLAAEPQTAHRLCFEIPATLSVETAERCALFVAAVREVGCLVTLDGFGSGSHSFQLLKRLRPDFLKIDEDFVRRLGAHAVDYEIVLGISRVAKSLHVKTIAEGVATPAARELLCRMGVDLMQGPLLAPIVAVD